MQIQIKAKELTTYSTLMVYKLLRGFALFVLMLSLTACPGDGAGNSFFSLSEKSNLISVSPLQTSYNLNDELIYKISIPSTNNYFGLERDMYSETKNTNAILTSVFLSGFINNPATFLKGEINIEHPNEYILIYNPNNQLYELEVKIKLNQAKTYLYEYKVEEILLKKNGNNGFKISTSIEGIEPTQPYQITVQ